MSVEEHGPGDRLHNGKVELPYNKVRQILDGNLMYTHDRVQDLRPMS